MKKGWVLIMGFLVLLSCAPAVVDQVVHGVLIAGSVQVNSGNYNAVYWDNGVLHVLDTRNSFVYHSFRDGSDLYVLGYYYDTFGDRHYGYWKNGVFVALGYTFSSVKKIAVANGKVYVAGKLTNTSAGYWENGVYHAVYASDHYFMQATGIAVSGTNIAVVGSTNFLYSEGYWLNSVYHEVTNFTGWYSPYYVGDVLRILCGTNIYICGNIPIDGNQIPCYLKNGQLFQLDTTLPYGSIGKTIQYNGEIYFAGMVTDNTNMNACCWKITGACSILDTRESLAELIND